MQLTLPPMLQTLQTKEGGDSVRRLRNLMRDIGRGLPLRLETLEILQLADRYAAYQCALS